MQILWDNILDKISINIIFGSIKRYFLSASAISNIRLNNWYFHREKMKKTEEINYHTEKTKSVIPVAHHHPPLMLKKNLFVPLDLQSGQRFQFFHLFLFVCCFLLSRKTQWFAVQITITPNIRMQLYEIYYFISQNQLLNSICCQVVDWRKKANQITNKKSWFYERKTWQWMKLSPNVCTIVGSGSSTYPLMS